MSNRFRHNFSARLSNWLVTTFLRFGVPMGAMALLTVVCPCTKPCGQ